MSILDRILRNPTPTQQYSQPIGPQRPTTPTKKEDLYVELPKSGNISSPNTPVYTREPTTGKLNPVVIEPDKKSGGGGGRSGGSNVSTPTNQTIEQINQSNNNIPVVNGVDLANDKPISQPNKLPSIFEQAKSFVVNQYNSFTGKTQRDIALQQEQQRLIGGIREQSFTQSGRGTIVKSTKPYTNEELIKGTTFGAISREGALNTIAYNEQQKVQNQFNNEIFTKSQAINEKNTKIAKDYSNKATEIYNSEVSRIQNDLNSGKITQKEADKLNKEVYDSVNQRLGNQVKTLNEQGNQELQGYANNWINTRGVIADKEIKKTLDKASDKILVNREIANIPLYVAGGIVTAGTLGAVAGISKTSATAVNIGSQVLLGGSIGAEGYGLYHNIREGTFSASKVAGALIPFVAFGVGAGIGSKIVSGPKLTTDEQIRFNNAVQNSDVIVNTGKGLSEETAILKIGLNENQAPQVIGAMRKGATVREIEVKLRPQAQDQAIVNKGLSGLKIKGVEVTRLLPNGQVDQFIVANIRATKGFNRAELGAASQGKGYFDEEGILRIEKLNTLSNNKGIISASKTLDISKAKSNPINVIEANRKVIGNILKANYNEVITSKGREIISESKTFEGKKITAEKGKTITIEQLKEVAQSNYNKLIREAKGKETQAQIKNDKQKKIIEKVISEEKFIKNVYPNESTVKLKKKLNVNGKEQLGANIYEIDWSTKNPKLYQREIRLNKSLNKTNEELLDTLLHEKFHAGINKIIENSGNNIKAKNYKEFKKESLKYVLSEEGYNQLVNIRALDQYYKELGYKKFVRPEEALADLYMKYYKMSATEKTTEIEAIGNKYPELAKDIKNLFQMEQFKELPKEVIKAQLKGKQTFYKEIARLKEVKLGNQRIFKTIQGQSVSKAIKENIPIKQIKVNKEGFEDFGYLVPKNNEASKLVSEFNKASGESSIKSETVKPKAKQEIKEVIFAKSDISTQVEQATQRLMKDLNIKGKTKSVSFKSSLNKAIQDSSNKLNTNTTNIPKFNVKQADITFESINTGQGFNQGQRSQLKELQKLEQSLNLNQGTITPNPIIDIPNLDIFGGGFPSGRGGGQEAQIKKLLRRITRKKSGYTSSLANAVFQTKGLKVTKKQLKALQNKEFTGLESRPLLQIVDDKQVKKLIKKVNF